MAVEHRRMDESRYRSPRNLDEAIASVQPAWSKRIAKILLPLNFLLAVFCVSTQSTKLFYVCLIVTAIVMAIHVGFAVRIFFDRD
ncbi:hypothetical protein [Sphingobium yanoikuyae]|uniref:hypothetical protein n=1 Tax=Sphingobium yanoikuyae TaxID=13690 RepID=UPI0026EDFA4F|nr:hypothetical protein [Sphingobium yanoikuyae]